MHEFIYSKEDLVGILKNHITTGERWDGYKRTVEVAEFWNKIVTGKNHGDILLSMKPAEDKPQKQQRLRLYNSRTKSVANKIINQIKEVYRSDNIFNEIYFTDKKDDNSDKVKKINESLNGFSGNKSVRQWLRDRYLRLNIVDPNAFLVVNFRPVGAKTAFFPIEVRSKDVLSRQYLNGTLQYLAFVEKSTEKVTIDGKIKTLTSYKYWIFGDQYAVLFHKCPEGGQGIGIPYTIQATTESYMENEGIKYSWYYSDYKIDAQQVPAYCVGYIPDPENDDNTFQSIMYPSEELQKELIWKKSMADLHMILHGIAQKFAFVPRCDFNDKTLGLECREGKLTNGDKCSQCGGSGMMPFHTSEQDIITIALPKNGGELFDLSKMMHNQPIPLEVIKMCSDEVKDLEKAIPLSIFNTSQIDKGQLTSPDTATKVLDDKNSTTNVLYDFGLADAAMYISIVTQIAIYDNTWRPDMVVDYSYPTDFNLESVYELFEQSTEAIATNSPAIVRSKINSKIISKLCIDDKSAIQNYQAREYWRPFTDSTQVTMVPEFDKSRILYIYFDQIFRTLENAEYTNTEGVAVPFSSLPRDKQKGYIDQQVDAFILEYKKAKEQTPKITIPRNV